MICNQLKSARYVQTKPSSSHSVLHECGKINRINTLQSLPQKRNSSNDYAEMTISDNNFVDFYQPPEKLS